MKSPTPHKFKLKQEYLTSIPETKKMTLFLPNGKTISGDSYGTIDHPSFTKFRNKLEAEGYIKIEHSWINGDRVLKPFILNGMPFNQGDQFPCAIALSVRFDVAAERKKKS